MCTSNRDDASLRILSSKADSNTWESFTRSELKMESVHQESPRSDIFRKTKPLLKQKHHQTHLTWAKEKKLDCCSVVQSPLFILKSIFHLIWKSRSQSLEEEWRDRIHVAWSPVEVHSVMFGLPCHLLVLVHCVFWSPQSTQHLPGDFRALYASIWWQALWRCWFHFPAGLDTCPHCQRYQKLDQWPWLYCAWLAIKLAWPEPRREYMGFCQEEDERHQTRQYRWPEDCYQSNLGFITPE